MGAIPEKIAEVVYSEDFLQQNIAGKATVRLDIDEKGIVSNAELIKFTDKDGNTYRVGDGAPSWFNSLGQSLAEAAFKSEFNPAIICGEPVPVQQLFTFDIDPLKK